MAGSDGSKPIDVAVIRTQLAKLCTHGLTEYWVLDECPDLLRLHGVRASLGAAPSGAEEVEALGAYLRSLLPAVQKRQHRELLRIVLMLDDRYREIRVSQRREIAGRTFRPGARPVQPGTIRSYHEPRALDAFSKVIAADEAARRRGDAAD